MPRVRSFGTNPASRIASWLYGNRQYLFLLLLDLIALSAWSVATGIAPAGDIRAHIFRTLDFSQGLAAGDYTSIQYHGYAFLAGYGVGFYALTWAMYSLLSLFSARFLAATVACNLMWLATPLVLSLSAIALADELGMRRSDHRRLMQVLLGATVLLLPGGGLSLAGADPYMLSFSFSLMALVFGLRTRENTRAFFGLVAFSALSIYTEGFGYFFTGTVFLALIATRRPVLRALPILGAVTAFSWVQLAEVSGFTSPYIEYVPFLGIDFLTFFGAMVILVGGYALFSYALRGSVGERQGPVYVILAVTIAASFAAVARGSLGWNFWMLNGVVDNILPWRLLFLNVPVLIFVSAYALSAGPIRLPNIPKALAVVSILLVTAQVALGTYPVTFDALPSAGRYTQFSGDRLLVAGGALTSPSSVVAYSPAFGYSTVSGPFAQGDPSFYSITAYYEWSQQFVSNPTVADNLMHLTGADQLVTSAGGVSESYINDSVPFSQAVTVTPILIEAPNATEAMQFALFVNLLGSNGYMLDFVTSAPSGEVYGVVVLPGFHGSIPDGLPVYRLNESQLEADQIVPLVKQLVTPPFDFFGPVSAESIDLATSMAASLISFFHPVYSPAELAEGPGYYSVSSNSSLPIQLAVSYYPYFSPADYSQNVYRFILLPGPGTITWHLPLYEPSAAVSLLAAVGVAVTWWLRRGTQGSAHKGPPSRQHLGQETIAPSWSRVMPCGSQGRV